MHNDKVLLFEAIRTQQEIEQVIKNFVKKLEYFTDFKVVKEVFEDEYGFVNTRLYVIVSFLEKDVDFLLDFTNCINTFMISIFFTFYKKDTEYITVYNIINKEIINTILKDTQIKIEEEKKIKNKKEIQLSKKIIL